ncbi:MAG: phage antirepressor KilAC domain-containing protein [Bacilli bacterium]
MTNQLVFLTDNVVTTSSRVVAEYFGKRHKHVLDAISTKIDSAENPAQLETMFFESTYKDASGKSNREVIMNRDGFSLLAMGFTGAKALEFQLKFIAEFNRMEEQIRSTVFPTTYIAALEAFLESEKQKEQLRVEAEQLAVALVEAKPKVEYHDIILSTTDTMTIGQIAEDYGLSAVKLNKILHEHGIQYRDGKTWYLYSTYKGTGLTESETFPYVRVDGTTGSKVHMRWTQKGRLLIHETLTADGYIANYDRERGGVR